MYIVTNLRGLVLNTYQFIYLQYQHFTLIFYSEELK